MANLRKQDLAESAMPTWRFRSGDKINGATANRSDTNSTWLAQWFYRVGVSR